MMMARGGDGHGTKKGQYNWGGCSKRSANKHVQLLQSEAPGQIDTDGTKLNAEMEMGTKQE